MSQSVIQVSNLSKSYRLGSIGSRTLSEDLNRWWARLRKQPDPYLRIGQEHLAERMGERIWALKDINFEVQQGEALGIIGRNGAGKSTLLKILSRITAPTTGEIRIKGRIASLLEVGTGFHPELTGRENIFLNGAILGMKRPEIERKFDEIVDFAGVEKFIDTPVKRYSSGMYVRLAFAVAAHLDPEILVVDEVLAVGDAEFQKKCLGKMGEVAGEGRTVLFVSHNLVAIQNLCSRSILILNGEIKKFGETQSVINSYLPKINGGKSKYYLNEAVRRKGDLTLQFTHVEICDDAGNSLENIISGQNIHLRFYYKSQYFLRDAEVHISTVVHDQEYALTNINSIDSGQSRMSIYKEGYFECVWPNFNLTARSYNCSLFCSINGRIADWIDTAFKLEVLDGDYYNSGKKIGYQSKFLVNHTWLSNEVNKISETISLQ